MVSNSINVLSCHPRESEDLSVIAVPCRQAGEEERSDDEAISCSSKGQLFEILEIATQPAAARNDNKILYY
jgi:hypothetical protein